MKPQLLWFLTIAATTALSCSRSPLGNESSANKGRAPVVVSDKEPARDQEKVEKAFADFFIKGDSLSYNDYDIVKVKRWTREDGYPKKKFQEPCAELRRHGAVARVFNGVWYGGLAAIDFGLAPLLSPESKQIIVSQTRARGGRHWVVDPSDGRILFDSFEYEVGREDVWITDVDRDGVNEIILELPAFYMFETMAGPLSPSVTPLPGIIFRYDPKVRKYLPANPHFGFGLEGIDYAIERLDSSAAVESFGGGYLSPRLAILLRYIFAGHRDEGWVFFDQYYRLIDKDQMKISIKAVLAKQPVYRFIYANAVRNHAHR